MILSILIALYLTVIVWFIRTMPDIPISKDGIVYYRWIWIIGYVIYAILWPIIAPIIIHKVRKELIQKKMRANKALFLSQ